MSSMSYAETDPVEANPDLLVVMPMQNRPCSVLELCEVHRNVRLIVELAFTSLWGHTYFSRKLSSQVCGDGACSLNAKLRRNSL